MVNTSASMPVGFYALDQVDRPIARGDAVVICAPATAAALGAARGYLGSGTCPAKTDALLKLVAAIAGDVVDLGSHSIAVDGKCLGESVTFDRDSAGRRLPRIARGRYRLEPNQIWLWAPAERSFDSRYFGPVDARAVTNIARPVAVRPALAGLSLSNGPCPTSPSASAT
jgi:conjugative transfer signal peptidase TraF